MPVSKLCTYLVCLVFLSSCKREKPIEPAPPKTFSNGVLVTNEGTFLYGNASVSFFRKGDGTIEKDAFKSVNNRPLGDVLQSVTDDNGYYWFVINNSQKIEVTDHEMKSIATITGFTSPRYFLPVNSAKAYVSDLYADGISIVDSRDKKITGKISIKGGSGFDNWTEQMVLSGNKAFACQVKKSRILVINITTDKMVDIIQLTGEPQWMTTDSSGNIWVLSDGVFENVPPSITCINAANDSIEWKTTLGVAGTPVSVLKPNAERSRLYFICSGDVKYLDVKSKNSGLFRASNGRHFYGIGIDEATNEVYISDAIDYLQQGKVYRYSSDGTDLGSFDAGINPRDFIFVK